MPEDQKSSGFSLPWMTDSSSNQKSTQNQNQASDPFTWVFNTLQAPKPNNSAAPQPSTVNIPHAQQAKTIAPPIAGSAGGPQAGIGLVLSPDQMGGYEVMEKVPGGSASRALKVEPGDVLVAVDGKKVHGLRDEEVANLILGPVGSSVCLTLRKRDGDVLSTHIVRMPTQEGPHPDLANGDFGGQQRSMAGSMQYSQNYRTVDQALDMHPNYQTIGSATNTLNHPNPQLPNMQSLQPFNSVQARKQDPLRDLEQIAAEDAMQVAQSVIRDSKARQWREHEAETLQALQGQQQAQDSVSTEEHKKLQAKHWAAEDAIAKLREMVQTRTREVQRTTEERDVALKAAEAAELENKVLGDKLMQLAQEHQKMEETLRNMQGSGPSPKQDYDYRALQHESMQKEELLNSLRKESEDYRVRMEQMTQENRQMTGELQTLRDMMQGKTSMEHTMVQEQEFQAVEAKRLQGMVDIKQKEYDMLNQENNRIKKDHDFLQMKNLAKERETAHLQKLLEDRDKQIASLQTQIGHHANTQTAFPTSSTVSPPVASSYLAQQAPTSPISSNTHMPMVHQRLDQSSISQFRSQHQQMSGQEWAAGVGR